MVSDATRQRTLNRQGLLLQGSGFFAIGSFRFLSGTATFDKAERKSGAPVEGRVKLKVLHMHMR